MDNFEKIAAYVEGELSAEESAQFEQAMEANPELLREVGFQKDIVQGIQDFRKAELKARLDQLQVGSVSSSAVAASSSTASSRW